VKRGEEGSGGAGSRMGADFTPLEKEFEDEAEEEDALDELDENDELEEPDELSEADPIRLPVLALIGVNCGEPPPLTPPVVEVTVVEVIVTEPCCELPVPAIPPITEPPTIPIEAELLCKILTFAGVFSGNMGLPSPSSG
jgi:hypothetical protein